METSRSQRWRECRALWTDDETVIDPGAYSVDLLAHDRPDVERGHHGAEAPSRRHGLKAGHAGAEHQHLGRGDRPGSRHQHREELLQPVGREQHRLVARDGAL